VIGAAIYSKGKIDDAMTRDRWMIVHWASPLAALGAANSRHAGVQAPILQIDLSRHLIRRGRRRRGSGMLHAGSPVSWAQCGS
jgi:hypothetical protein